MSYAAGLFAVLALSAGLVAAPQGLTGLLEKEGVLGQAQQLVAGPGKAKRSAQAAFVTALQAAGVDAPSVAERWLLVPKARRVPLALVGLLGELHGSSPHPSPGPDARPVRLDRKLSFAKTKDIDRFFTKHHRACRKALGLEPNLALTIPDLHALLQRLLAAPGYVLTAEDTKTLRREHALASRVDLGAMLDLAAQLLAATDQLVAARDRLAAGKAKTSRHPGVTGTVLLDRETPYGRLVIGGPGRNIYDCSQLAVIVDVGGDDRYEGAAGGADVSRRYAVCIDLAGDDHYAALNGALGSATYGLGVLIDVAGDDVYQAGARSAGCGIAGVGVFVDRQGRDELTVGDASGGVGMFGLGLCLDAAGDDQQRGGRGAYGVGLPGGVGLFVDGTGADKRELRQGTLGFGAATGFGLAMPAGLGVCLDFAGDDAYTCGDFALGAGDRGGVGVCVDFLGDDTYITKGLCLGAARRQGRGVLLEMFGKDHYFAAEGLAVALDGAAWFLDRSGDDIYESFGEGLGFATAAAFACFQDLGGADRIRSTARAPRLLAGQAVGGLAVFRSKGQGDTYAPRRRDPASWAAARVARERARGRLFLSR